MGPNGSGKSTLANVLLGNPAYEVTAGSIRFHGEDVTSWPTDVRGKAGLFLAFQDPEAIGGVPVIQFLRQALSARRGMDLSVLEVRLMMMEWMEKLGMDPAFGERHLNEGFSGGEKKRNEILQMAILEPELAVLDETDSGLDVDALRTVARGVRTVRAARPETRGAGHQPLPAHARGARGRPGPPAGRRGDRRGGRAGARPAGSRSRGTTHGGADPARPASLTLPRWRRTSLCSPARSTADPITYLDSAASSQRPTAVLDAMREYDETTHANVHRGVYAIAEEATRRFEAARVNVGRFIGAPDPAREIVFTKNATEALNLVAHAWGRTHLQRGDVVVLTEMEHHANIVPWHMLAAERGIELRWLPIDDDGFLVLDDLDRVLDGRQAARGHLHVQRARHPHPDGRPSQRPPTPPAPWWSPTPASRCPTCRPTWPALGVDFLAFSAHKMLGPTGIGVLWGRAELLDDLPPFLGGGEMILDVRKDGFTPNEVPWRFEAGTPPITEAIGLGAAVDYLRAVGMDAVREHEMALTDYALGALRERFGDGIRIFGPTGSAERGGVMSFAFGDLHPHDISQILDEYGVCVRAGHHCAKPLMRRLGVTATARASFALYNDEADVDTLVEALDAAAKFFAMNRHR